ncbi:unnamed protein product [Fusarium graminearum]|uniref:Uncharacterized protein n=1 Tax=Gibberella zeae TaxID=5518 RepID=A0A679NZS6_GIBZA|nr:unnamed protein product [Fusarium graminearum]CAG2011898.1 unnamed protein product [Fusarium graminearum]CZS82228.1 unnamed protein product [Fusarium graminearum]
MADDLIPHHHTGLFQRPFQRLFRQISYGNSFYDYRSPYSRRCLFKWIDNRKACDSMRYPTDESASHTVVGFWATMKRAFEILDLYSAR